MLQMLASTESKLALQRAAAAMNNATTTGRGPTPRVLISESNAEAYLSSLHALAISILAWKRPHFLSMVAP